MSQSLIQKYRQMLEQDPASTIFVELAKVLLEEGEPAKAVEICQHGLAHHAKSIIARVLWGKALINMGKPGEAMGQFDAAVAIEPENPYAYNLIAEVLMGKKLYRSALPILRRAVQLQPNDERLQAWLNQANKATGGSKPQLEESYDDEKTVIDRKTFPDGDAAILVTSKIKQPAVQLSEEIEPTVRSIAPPVEPTPPAPASVEAIEQQITPTEAMGTVSLEEAKAFLDHSPVDAQMQTLPPSNGLATEVAREVDALKPPPLTRREITNPRFVLSMIPDAAPERAPTPVLAGPDREEAAKIAARYEQELRQKLLGRKERPTWLKRHFVKVVVGGGLALLTLGGSASYMLVQRSRRSDFIREDITQARNGLARDTVGALRLAAERLDDALDRDPVNREAISLSAQVAALLWVDYADAEAKTLAERRISEGIAGEGTIAARYLLAADPAQRKVAEVALSEVPESAGPLLQVLAGRLSLSKKDVEGAIKRFERAAKAAPPSLRALADLGDLYKEQGNLDQALSYYLTAIGAHRTHPRSVIGAAEIRLQTGRDIDKALEDLKAVDAEPKSHPAASDRLRYELAMAKAMAASGARVPAVERLLKATEKIADRPEVPAALSEVYALAGAHDKAESEAHRAVKLAPKDPSHRVLLARALMARAKYRDLLKQTEGIDSRQVRLYRGIARYELKDYAGARQELELTRRESKMPADAAVFYALTDLARGKTAEAKDLLTKLAYMKNPPAMAYVALGRLELAEGHVDDAEKLFRNAAERDSTNPDGFRALGKLLLQRRRGFDAIAPLAKAVSLNPFHIDTRLALGQAKLAAGDAPGAKAEFVSVLADRPRDPLAHRGLAGAYLGTREPLEARRAAKRAAELNPRDAETWAIAGRATLAQGETWQGMKALERARDLAPRNPDYHSFLGDAYLKMGSLPQARKAYESAAKLDPKDIAHRVGLARVDLANRDYKGALKELLAAESSVPRDADPKIVARLHASLARAYLGLGKPESVKAEKEALAAIVADATLADGHYALGRALEEQDAAAARKALEKAVHLEPGSPEFRFALGNLLSRDGGDATRASQELNEYLRLAPKGADAAAAKKVIATLKTKK
jgi:tetratricopeptide (TPR) repeat protein